MLNVQIMYLYEEGWLFLYIINLDYRAPTGRITSAGLASNS